MEMISALAVLGGVVLLALTAPVLGADSRELWRARRSKVASLEDPFSVGYDFRVRREMFEAEAALDRLLRSGAVARPSRAGRVLVWAGARLVRWGEGLQALAGPREARAALR